MRWPGIIKILGTAPFLIRPLLLSLLLLSLSQVSHATDDQRGHEIVDRVAGLFSGKSSSIATLQMRIDGENGQRDLTIKIWSQGEDALVRILSPEKDAGTAILKIGSDLWYYLPKVNRTIKASSSTMSSWMGSD